jgi:hypothetical protein
VIMRCPVHKRGRRFDTVPLAEVLKHAVAVDGEEVVSRTTEKDEPYKVCISSMTDNPPEHP